MPATTASSNPLLEVQHLTKSYRAVTALSDVSFAVGRGEVVGLIGPNGAGKTTLFECLAGLLPRDSGVVTAEARPIAPGSSQLFYVPDGIAPWPAETVRWALDYAIGFFGGSAADRTGVVRGLGLEAVLDRTIGTLSKGQRKRAVLAVGLLMPHPLLVIDEPFDGLDLRQTREVAAVLRAQTSSHRTMLLSIHQIPDAARVCDRFILLSAGRVCGAGTLAELTAQAASRAALAGEQIDPGRATLEEVFLALT